LLRIDFVSRMKAEGFFYYAMELGDAATPGWEQEPTNYKPLDLAAMAATFANGRIPMRDCMRVATKLCDPLHFLHSQGLAHRDIKPRNIIFVNGEPKLADVGLVTDAHRSPQEVTLVGTPGYMPPAPEPPGTPRADIFGLGMVLYVISTGDGPKAFPEVSTTLVDRNRNQSSSRPASRIVKNAFARPRKCVRPCWKRRPSFPSEIPVLTRARHRRPKTVPLDKPFLQLGLLRGSLVWVRIL
jgi:serine/threonine protein kinase